MFDFIFGALKSLLIFIIEIVGYSDNKFLDHVIELFGILRDWVTDKIGDVIIGLREKYKSRQRNKKEEKSK